LAARKSTSRAHVTGFASRDCRGLFNQPLFVLRHRELHAGRLAFVRRFGRSSPHGT